MVCISGKTKIKSTLERVSGMKEKKEKIDLILERNAAEQLAKLDWEGLNTAISSRLDKAGLGKTSTIGLPTVFKIAAAVTAAAAVVFILVTVRNSMPPGVRFENGGKAVVKLVESKGTASIEIKHASAKSAVMVDVVGSHKKVARCDVEMIDLNGGLKKDSDGAAWIIISRPEPALADNGTSPDMTSMICLF